MRRRQLKAPAEDEQFYEDFMAEKDIAGWGKDERKNVRRKTVVDYLADAVSPSANILDVGCGYGETLLGIPESYQLNGFDYAHSNIEAARRLLHDRDADVKQGSIYDIPFDDESQDVCICLEVLEHIEDDARGALEIARVLKPDGILIASVPYAYYWPQYERLIGHYRHYTRQSFVELLDGSNLKVKEYLPNYPNWHLAYARRYCLVRFYSILFGWILRRRDVFEFKWPWSQKPSMQKVAEKLDSLFEKDQRIDYGSLDSSTFVVAERPRN